MLVNPSVKRITEKQGYLTLEDVRHLDLAFEAGQIAIDYIGTLKPKANYELKYEA
jgi:hypothetical protein